MNSKMKTPETPEKMWSVYEVEDDEVQFTVSSIPINWIIKIDNVLFCYWPKKNAEQKIRTCEHPNFISGNWSLHKCRLLMNGEKFSKYKDAKKAELICQNVSTMSEYSAKLKAETNQTKRHRNGEPKEFRNKIARTADSTMEFHIETVGETESSSQEDMRVINGFKVESVNDNPFSDDDNDFFVGGGTDLSGDQNQSNTVDIQSDVDEQSDKKSYLLEFCEDSIMSSTRLDEPQFNKDVSKEIEQIKLMVSLFSNDLSEKLDQVKASLLPKVQITGIASCLPEDIEVSLAKSEAKNLEDECLHETFLTDSGNLQDKTFLAEKNSLVKNCIDADSGIKLPIVTNEQFINSEDALETNEAINKALIQNLSALDYTKKTEFMYGVIDYMFGYSFFMEKVSWKKEPNRILIKDTEILKCWMASYTEKFGEVIASDYVHTICTNYKSKERKKDKAKGLNKGKNK